MTYDYDAFGKVTTATGSVSNSILYGGYQYDGETGMYYLNARYYDPVTARFISEDTYYGQSNDPLSLNLYTYCCNEPLMFLDPSGHEVTLLDAYYLNPDQLMELANATDEWKAASLIKDPIEREAAQRAAHNWANEIRGYDTDSNGYVTNRVGGTTNFYDDYSDIDALLDVYNRKILAPTEEEILVSYLDNLGYTLPETFDVAKKLLSYDDTDLSNKNTNLVNDIKSVIGNCETDGQSFSGQFELIIKEYQLYKGQWSLIELTNMYSQEQFYNGLGTILYNNIVAPNIKADNKSDKYLGQAVAENDKLYIKTDKANSNEGSLKTPTEIAKSCPIEIPSSAKVVEQTKTGYNQIKYTWSDGTYKYEARWHTRTPGAPEGQGNTWVITRTTPGTAQGQQKVQSIMTGENQWTSMEQWQDAVTARQNGTATIEQQKLLDSGHWPAP